jgi:mitochondrial fission protein ELM1
VLDAAMIFCDAASSEPESIALKPHFDVPALTSVGRLPRIWALLSPRQGDNAQVLAVAEALGWPFETRRFSNGPGAIAANLIAGPDVPGIVRHDPGEFDPPWPDLILAAGTQSEPICARIRRNAQRDGHRTRLVFLGRPWMDPGHYDLVVTTPQYRVAPAPNVMEIDLPLHRVTAEGVAGEAARWAPRLAHLPRPWIAVFIGAGINRYTLDSRAAKRLALESAALAGKGSLLVCGSYRTPPRAMQVIQENLPVPACIFDWHRSDGDNPYRAFLGLADGIIVTGDSMTMLAEACATGKPVYIFDLGEGRFAMRQDPPPHPSVAVAHPWLMSALRARAMDLKVRFTNSIIPRRLHRDTRPIHRKLIASGRAVWLGDDFPVDCSTPSIDDVSRVAARVRGLVGLEP